jgi:hypothetical protein
MSDDIGILSYETVKRTKYYSVSRDILSSLSNNELLDLLNAVSLYKNITFPVTAGYYTEKAIKDNIKYERKQSCGERNLFCYKACALSSCN